MSDAISDQPFVPPPTSPAIFERRAARAGCDRSPLRAAIRGLDAWLRRTEPVVEFTASRRCLLRVAVTRAEGRARLCDGVVVAPGAPILALHFWNEQMPATAAGPGMAWAARFSRQLRHSFAELAARLDQDPSLSGVVAIRGRFPVSGARRAGETRRFAARFGLEMLDEPPRLRLAMRLHNVAEDLWLWALAWAFNPGCLKARAFARRRDDLWISRARLIGLYGSRQPSRPSRTARFSSRS